MNSHTAEFNLVRIAKHSMCCRIGAYNGYGKDTCTRDNKFCQNASGDGVWRESCTDPTWQDPACQKLFVNGTGYPGAGTTYGMSFV